MAIAVVLLVLVIWVYSTGGGSNNPLDKPWDARSYEQTRAASDKQRCVA